MRYDTCLVVLKGENFLPSKTVKRCEHICIHGGLDKKS